MDGTCFFWGRSGKKLSPQRSLSLSRFRTSAQHSSANHRLVVRRTAQQREGGETGFGWQVLYLNIIISNPSVRAGGPSPMKSVELGWVGVGWLLEGVSEADVDSPRRRNYACTKRGDEREEGGGDREMRGIYETDSASLD